MEPTKTISPREEKAQFSTGLTQVGDKPVSSDSKSSPLAEAFEFNRLRCNHLRDLLKILTEKLNPILSSETPSNEKSKEDSAGESMVVSGVKESSIRIGESIETINSIIERITL